MDELSANQTRLLHALPDPVADPATPADLATASGLGYSTVTRLLRELATIGLATKDATGWRAAPDTSPTAPPDATAPDPDPDLEAGATVSAGNPTGDQRDHAAGVEPCDAGHAGHHPATDVQRPDPEPGRADGATTTRPDDERAPVRNEVRPRMGKGELRELVLTVLRDDGGALGPTQIAKKLPGRSQGAIANACDRLVEHGHAMMSSERPRRYTATTSS